MPVGVVHLSLTELGPSEVELRYWRDNPNDSTPRTLATAEIADLAAMAEAGNLAYGWGKGGSRRASGEEGPGLEIDCDAIASLAVELGQAVTRGAIAEALNTPWKLPGAHQPGPAWARACPGDTASRTLQVRGGTIQDTAPVGHGPACRREVFPAPLELTARLAQLLSGAPGSHRPRCGPTPFRRRRGSARR